MREIPTKKRDKFSLFPEPREEQQHAKKKRKKSPNIFCVFWIFRTAAECWPHITHKINKLIFATFPLHSEKKKTKAGIYTYPLSLSFSLSFSLSLTHNLNFVFFFFVVDPHTYLMFVSRRDIHWHTVDSAPVNMMISTTHLALVTALKNKNNMGAWVFSLSYILTKQRHCEIWIVDL